MASLLALADEVIELPLFAAPAHVRFWHKADIRCGAMQCLLLGVKRTLIGPAPMSAFDPKRTSAHKIAAVQRDR
jgi:hypothetical protein